MPTYQLCCAEHSRHCWYPSIIMSLGRLLHQMLANLVKNSRGSETSWKRFWVTTISSSKSSSLYPQLFQSSPASPFVSYTRYYGPIPYGWGLFCSILVPCPWCSKHLPGYALRDYSWHTWETICNAVYWMWDSCMQSKQHIWCMITTATKFVI